MESLAGPEEKLVKVQAVKKNRLEELDRMSQKVEDVAVKNKAAEKQTLDLRLWWKSLRKRLTI